MSTSELHNAAYWLRTFATRFTHFFNHSDAWPSSFALHVHQQFVKMEPQQAGVERFFFRVYMQAFIIVTLSEQSAKRVHQVRWFPDMQTVTHQCATKMIGIFADLPELLRHQRSESAPVAERKTFSLLLQDCLRFLEHQLEQCAGRSFWLTVYVEALLALRADQAFFQAEAEHVAKMPKSLHGFLMQSALHFSEGNDTQARERLLQASGEANEVYSAKRLPVDRNVLHFLDCLQREQAWARLYGWLCALPTKAESHNGKDVRLLLDHWLRLPKAYRTEAELEQVLADMHPWSHAEYSAFLLSQQRFDEWYVLYLSLCHHQGELIAEVPVEVSEQRPELLLVLHHQWIDRVLSTRSVKHEEVIARLQKLRTHYERLQRAEDWLQYIAGLKLKYKRSRALLRMMEEAEWFA
jgi:hypothetical protein